MAGTEQPAARFWMETAAGLVVAVKAHPGAKRVRIGPVIAAAAAPGWPDARLKVAVPAVAESGQANGAIRRVLADWLGIPPSRLAQQAGATARDKKFLVAEGRAAEFAGELARHLSPETTRHSSGPDTVSRRHTSGHHRS